MGDVKPVDKKWIKYMPILPKIKVSV